MGQKKTVNINLEEFEAIFWSDQSVNKVLAPFYTEPKIVTGEDQAELEEELGRPVNAITQDIVKQMWDKPNHPENTEADKPAMILKQRKCIPTTRPCRYGCR